MEEGDSRLNETLKLLADQMFLTLLGLSLDQVQLLKDSLLLVYPNRGQRLLQQ